jgi:hypothetical protein
VADVEASSAATPNANSAAALGEYELSVFMTVTPTSCRSLLRLEVDRLKFSLETGGLKIIADAGHHAV